jgi:hypothetical protein
VRKLSCLLMVAVLIGLMQAALPSASAAELKPVVTVSLAGYDQLMSSLGTIGKLVGQPALGKNLEAALNMRTGGKVLAGLKKDAPCGLMVANVTGPEPTVVGFLPLADAKPLMEVLKGQAGLPVEENNGAYEVPTPRGPKITIVQRGAWMCFSNDKAQLEALPEDPGKLLGEMPKNYFLAVRISFGQIPQPMIDQAFTAYEMLLSMGLQKSPDESDEMYALRKKMTLSSFNQIKATVKDLDQLLIGVHVDSEANRVYADVDITPKPGSQLAEQAALMKTAKTDLAGFAAPGAMLTFRKSVMLTDTDAAQQKETLEQVQGLIAGELKKQELSEKDMQLAQDLLKDAFGAIIRTIEAKKIDNAAVVQSDGKSLFAAAGMAVADGKKVESIVEKLAAAAKEEGVPGADQFKLGAQTYKGIRFSTLSIPTPVEQLKPLVGDKLDVILGVGDTQAYIAAGSDAEKTLKQIIDRSQAEAGKAVAPMEMKFALAPLIKLLAAVLPENAQGPLQMFGPLLEQSSGKDHVNVTTQATETGLRTRLELEEGVIKAIGTVGSMFMMRGMPMPQTPGGNSPFGD